MRCVRRANSSIALGVGFSGRFYSNFFTIYIYYFIALVAFIALVTLARKRVFGRKGVRAIRERHVINTHLMIVREITYRFPSIIFQALATSNIVINSLLLDISFILWQKPKKTTWFILDTNTVRAFASRSHYLYSLNIKLTRCASPGPRRPTRTLSIRILNPRDLSHAHYPTIGNGGGNPRRILDFSHRYLNSEKPSH
jgi:hypothetical protein